VLLTFFEDGREIWATESEVVELGSRDDKVLRRARFLDGEELLNCRVCKWEVTDVLSDDQGRYLVFRALSDYPETTFWRLDLESEFKLRVLARLLDRENCLMSFDGAWIAGIKTPHRDWPVCEKQPLDHSNRITRDTNAAYKQIHETDAVVVGVDVSGGVWMALGESSDYWYWEGGESELKRFESDGALLYSVGPKEYLFQFGRGWRFREIKDRVISPERIVPPIWWSFNHRLHRREVLELLEISTLPHQARLDAICPSETISCVRWSACKTRVSIVWKGPKAGSWDAAQPHKRTELRVHRATDSLIHACAAKMANAASKGDIRWLPAELDALVANFRDAGSFMNPTTNQ
jgi:hypothetical protein